MTTFGEVSISFDVFRTLSSVSVSIHLYIGSLGAQVYQDGKVGQTEARPTLPTMPTSYEVFHREVLIEFK